MLKTSNLQPKSQLITAQSTSYQHSTYSRTLRRYMQEANQHSNIQSIHTYVREITFHTSKTLQITNLWHRISNRLQRTTRLTSHPKHIDLRMENDIQAKQCRSQTCDTKKNQTCCNEPHDSHRIAKHTAIHAQQKCSKHQTYNPSLNL